MSTNAGSKFESLFSASWIFPFILLGYDIIVLEKWRASTALKAGSVEARSPKTW